MYIKYGTIYKIKALLSKINYILFHIMRQVITSDYLQPSMPKIINMHGFNGIGK